MSWQVVRVNDDGRTERVNGEMCAKAAEVLAGAMRDQQTDDDVAAGWNYLPRPDRTASRPAGGETTARGRTGGNGAGPQRRRDPAV